MERDRSVRGLAAAITIALTLTLVFLAVEKHVRIPHAAYWYSPQTAPIAPVETSERGIILTVEPELAGVAQYPREDTADITRRSASGTGSSAASNLRRPPEPVAAVVLHAPVATNELEMLPLHSSNSQVDALMEAMNTAFDTPMHIVSAEQRAPDTPAFPLSGAQLDALAAPASIAGRMPEPHQLINELTALQNLVDPRATQSTPVRQRAYNGSPFRSVSISSNEALLVNHWIVDTQSVLNRLVMQHGLEHPGSVQDMDELERLANYAYEVSGELQDYEFAARLNRAAYSLQRRVALWRSIQSCLDSTTVALVPLRNRDLARNDLRLAIDVVDRKISETGDSNGWDKYLMLEELKAWIDSNQTEWNSGTNLVQKVLSRIHYQRLSEAQEIFLAQPEFDELASQLAVWGREPVDYRQLLTHVEQFEVNPIDRVRESIASTVQMFRHTDKSQQQLVAAAINDHYRNANVRLTVSQKMIERFLPDGTYEVRPVRQRILGADTQGNSAVQTSLSVRLIPDDTSWHIDLGVSGDMVSATRSSKGPAVFHNTSTAVISSHRYIRMNPKGFAVSSEPTAVASHDQLQKMSTDFDGLPVLGDFVRLIVREQFNQKRGLAQRVSRRIIANEADSELDRRLEEGLSLAEKQLQSRITGPLDKLNLNPMVVAMNTAEDRLTIRYRVASGQQLAAHTPRPRAPADNLFSLQIHQSAINNAIERIGLSGRTWTLQDLYEHLGQTFEQTDWTAPADIPSDITIRFADHNPATIEMSEGRLRLTLRIAELRQGDRMHIERFIVSSSYVPVADGLKAGLVRDGVVEIVSNKDRLPLRVIFAKVFVSRPEIQLIADSWQEDERAGGLAVSQLDIQDGWLGVALSESQSPHAARVAEKFRDFMLQ